MMPDSTLSSNVHTASPGDESDTENKPLLTNAPVQDNAKHIVFDTNTDQVQTFQVGRLPTLVDD